MRKIHPLPDNIIAQIAAGEVIERPAYAMKELLENAIDAKADTIQVFLENAGLRKIMVIDNGEGMTREDIQESYKHHTTSKLSAGQNLIGIKSLGFRGEALSSISSVSDLTIKSKTPQDNVGTIIQLQKGILSQTSSIGMPSGTSIIVENLFSSVPARKKFLKSIQTELRHSVNVFLQIALGYPHIRFQLVHNNRIILDFTKTKNDTPIERVKALFGYDVFSQLVPVTYEEEYIKIKGFISKPHLVSTNNQKQYIFINNRNITDRRISQLVKEAYDTLLDSSTYPLFILFIDLPHEMVDINVHPRKEHVALLNDTLTLNIVKKSIRKTLTEQNLSPVLTPWKLKDPNILQDAANVLRDEVLPWQKVSIAKILKGSDISQVHDLYVITQTYNGIMLIDQHAAHERILYEQFMKAFNKHKHQKKHYELSEAIVLHTTGETFDLFKQRRHILEKIGFSIEEFGNDRIKVTHVPLFFKDHNIQRLFTEIIEDKLDAIDSQSQTMMTYLACRSAIKAGDRLTKKQCKELLEELEKTSNNYTCPHGRPTKIEIPLRDIDRLFKRR